MAKRHVITAIAVYLIVFAVALRIFLAGHHITALVILVVAWAVIAAWIWRRA